MPDYRIYTVTSGGRIHGVPTIISCVDDREATEKARELIPGASIDVWERDRRVARISPHSARNQDPSLDPLALALRDVFGWHASSRKIERVREALTAHGGVVRAQGRR
jgi:hypothetical protein